MEIISALVGLAGVIIGSLITIAGRWLTEKKKNNRDLAYAAVLVAYTAKAIARDIQNIVEDFDEFQAHWNGEHLHYRYGSPILALAELDINWKVVSMRSLEKIFECKARLEGNKSFYDSPMAANMDSVEVDANALLDLVEICDMLLSAASGLREEAGIPKDQAIACLREDLMFYVERLRRYA